MLLIIFCANERMRLTEKPMNSEPYHIDSGLCLWVCCGLWIHSVHELLRTCLCFLILHEIINSCIKLWFAVMHCLHFSEDCLPVQGLSCLLVNFCSYFTGWIFTMNHCVILLTCVCWVSHCIANVFYPKVKRCFSDVSSLKMPKNSVCCPI